MRVLTGIDLPSDLVCGSLLLSRDIYGDEGIGPTDEVRFFSLPPASSQPLLPTQILDVEKSGIEDSSYVRALKRALLDEMGSWRPDVVHSHHLGYGMAQVLTTLEMDVPVVGFAHGTDVFDARHDIQARDLASAIAERCDLLVFPSVALVREAVDAGIRLPTERVRLVPWGISMPRRPAPPSRRPPTAGLSLLVACRLTANKDIATAIRAVALLPETVTMTIYGEGREEAALRRLVADLAIDSRVQFFPPVPRAELWKLMTEFDCAVFPTRETEAFGLFGLECQAHGLPLVTSDLPVFAEIFAASTEVFRAGDEESLAAVLKGLISDPEALSRLRAVGRVNASRYEIAQLAARLREVSLEARALRRGT